MLFVFCQSFCLNTQCQKILAFVFLITQSKNNQNSIIFGTQSPKEIWQVIIIYSPYTKNDTTKNYAGSLDDNIFRQNVSCVARTDKARKLLLLSFLFNKDVYG